MAQPLEREAQEERVRRSYAFYSEEEEDRWLDEFATPDFVWDMEPLGFGLFEGREAYRRFYEDWVASYDTWRVELEEVELPQPGVTVTRVVQRGTPRGTDQTLEFRWGQISLWEGGRIRRVINFETFEEAQAAASRIAAP
jgi:ketosteroid isomerase-like protein